MPLGLDRRRFLCNAGLAAGALVLPSGLAGCGSDDSDATGSALEVDPSRPWWLQNNFAPVFDELDVANPKVLGSVPEALSGTYVRNGSNPQNADSPHWFFGDGMVHGVRFDRGSVRWYRNRYIETPLYLSGTGFGEGAPPTQASNQSNVSCIYHAGRLLTSGEVGWPHELDPEDLSTIGAHGFDDQLNTSFTAHPKIDPATGYMHFFGYFFVPPYLTYHVADTSGRIIHSQVIDVAGPTMMHSFAITDRDVVFWELPVVFSLEAALAGESNPFQWDPSYGARIGVMPLGGLAEQIRWVEIEPCYVFHEVNAFRQGDEVVVDVCRLDHAFRDQRFGDADGNLVRWRIGTAGRDLTFRDEIVSERDIDLPAHDRRYTGRAHRYGWFVTTREHPDSVDLGGTTLVDYRTGAITMWDPGATRHVDEPFFVPNGSAEGEGWILAFVYDRAADRSHLAILEALNVQAGPIAEIEMPRRVPHGFHGVWIPA